MMTMDGGKLVPKFWFVEGILDHEPVGTKPHKISGIFRTGEEVAMQYACLAKIGSCSRRPDSVSVRCRRTHVPRGSL